MNIDWMSPELKSIIEMALISHELDHLKSFWKCNVCAPLREGITESIWMEAKVKATR